jgi:hypothetical protein
MGDSAFSSNGRVACTDSPSPLRAPCRAFERSIAKTHPAGKARNIIPAPIKENSVIIPIHWLLDGPIDRRMRAAKPFDRPIRPVLRANPFDSLAFGSI